MSKRKTPHTPPSSSELDAIAAQCTQMVDGTVVTLSRSELRQYTAHRRDVITREHRAKREKLAALRGDRVSARTYKAIQRQLDKVQRWYRPRRIKVGMAPETMPKVRFRTERIRPPCKLRLPTYSDVIVDRNGRVGVFVDFKYDGAKPNRFGVIRRRIVYLLDPSHCEKDAEGHRIAACNFGMLVEEICAGADLWELAQRESRRDAQLCKNIIVQLPHDVSPEVRRSIMKAIAHELFGRHGLPYVGSVHEPDPDGDQRNYHAHICGGLRPMTRTSYGQWDIAEDYRSDLDGPVYLGHARRVIADILTSHVTQAGINRVYTHESNAARGLPHRPQRKLDKRKTRLARQGEFVADVEANREIIANNEAVVRAVAAKVRANANRRQRLRDRSIRDVKNVASVAVVTAHSAVPPAGVYRVDAAWKSKSTLGRINPVARIDASEMNGRPAAALVNAALSIRTVPIVPTPGIDAAVKTSLNLTVSPLKTATKAQIKRAEPVSLSASSINIVAVDLAANQPRKKNSVIAAPLPNTEKQLPKLGVVAPSKMRSLVLPRSVHLPSESILKIASAGRKWTADSVRSKPVASPTTQHLASVHKVSAPAIHKRMLMPEPVHFVPAGVPEIGVSPVEFSSSKARAVVIGAVSLPSAGEVKPVIVISTTLPPLDPAHEILKATIAEGRKIVESASRLLTKSAWQRAKPRSDAEDNQGGSSPTGEPSKVVTTPVPPSETRIKAALETLEKIPQNIVAIPILRTKNGALSIDLTLRKTHKLTSPIMRDERVQALLSQIVREQREELDRFMHLFQTNGSAEDLADEPKALAILPNEEKAAAHRWAGTQEMETILRIGKERQQTQAKEGIKAWTMARASGHAKRYQLAAAAMRQCKRWAVSIDSGSLAAMKSDAEKYVPPRALRQQKYGRSRD